MLILDKEIIKSYIRRKKKYENKLPFNITANTLPQVIITQFNNSKKKKTFIEHSITQFGTLYLSKYLFKGTRTHFKQTRKKKKRNYLITVKKWSFSPTLTSHQQQKHKKIQRTKRVTMRK